MGEDRRAKSHDGNGFYRILDLARKLSSEYSKEEILTPVHRE